MIYKTITLVVLLTVLQRGKCEDFLVAVANRGKSAIIRYSAGATGGLVEVQCPRLAYRRADLLRPFYVGSHSVSDKMKITSDVENAAIIVSGSDEDINIVIDADVVFSPLPVSALGTKYILPSSLYPNSDYRSFLLIATHNMTTTVDVFFRIDGGRITFASYDYRDGDKLSLKLNPYQTLTIYTRYDLNGTVITGDHNIAVYSGMEYSYRHTVYDQLLPVKHYGQEYVVAVDDFKLDLQIISEHSHVQITFSSGATVSTGERRLYNRSLERGESLHFTTTRPVLVTLSRADGYSSSFTTVPPVHWYVTHTGVWLLRDNRFPDGDSLNTTLKVLTDRRATVSFQDMYFRYSLTWMHVAGNRYKVGTLIQPERYPFSTSISSDFPFTVLSFYNGSAHNIGYSFSVEAEEEVHYSGQTYLMALDDRYHIPWILASAGETGGQWQVQDPHSGRVWSRRFNPYNTDYFYPNTTATRVVLVHVRDDAIHIRGGMNDYTSFSPLPVTALGTMYILSSCLPTDNIPQYTTSFISVLVIATHSKKADIGVIFRLDGNVTYIGRTYNDGDTLSVKLDRYETFFLNSSSDMTGTTVNATETIAVYSGTYDERRAIFTTFEQLLPVKHYGHEYILAIQDPYYYYRSYASALPYQLQVLTAHSDTSILFNNGSSISVGEDGVYRKQCGNHETFYFNTTRPVMVTLCTFGRYFYNGGLVVIPPVSLYSTLTTQKDRGTVQIVTDQANRNVDVKNTYDTFSTVFSFPVKWKNVSGTRFKVGTLSGDRYTTTIRSNVSFAVLGYHYYSINNGGYSFKTYTDTGTSVPDGIGNTLDTSERFQETSTSDGIRIKLNTSASLQGSNNTAVIVAAGSSNNAAVIVGVVCGIVIVALLVAFIAYTFYLRRTTMPLKKTTTEQAAEAPSTQMNIYVLPDKVARCAASEDTYTELMFNSTSSDLSTPTYVNISDAMMNQQC